MGEWPWLGPAQIFLALLCLGFGLFPFAGIWLCHAAAGALWGAKTPAQHRLALRPVDAGARAVRPGRDRRAVVPGHRGLHLRGGLRAGPRHPAAGLRAEEGRGGVELRLRSGARRTEVQGRPLLHAFQEVRAFGPARVEDRLAPQGLPAVPRVLNPDGWAYDPAVGRMVGLFRWFAGSRVGMPPCLPPPGS